MKICYNLGYKMEKRNEEEYMAYRDLQHFIEVLRKENELIDVYEEVDSNLEITEISDRIMKSTIQNKALLFHHVKNSPYPVLINAFGSLKRMSKSLEVENLKSISDVIHDFMDFSNYKTLPKQIKSIPKLSRLYFSFPRKVKRAACQEVVEEPKLSEIPILKCWPLDGGQFVTLPLVITKDPETGMQNMGMYRLQVYDDKTTGMHWHWHKDGRDIYDKYRKLGIKKMPVSVAIGADPATVYSAIAPLPKMIDEMMLASFLRKKPLPIVKCKTNELYVPANSEFILEGYVNITEDLRLEGPFGDHTGYYSLPDMYPVFHVEKVTRKKKPVYHATIVGVPPMEDSYLGLATEEIFLPLMKIPVPEIKDLHMPFEGVNHNCAIISIEKKFPKHAFKSINSCWGNGQMMYEKLICVVDEGTDTHNYPSIFWQFVDHINLSEDLIITEGPLDALDHSSKRPFFGSRLGIDLTKKLPQETIDISDLEKKYLHLNEVNQDELLKQLQAQFPQIIDIRLPQNDEFYKVLIVKIDKQSIHDVSTINHYIRELNNCHFKLIAYIDQTTDIHNNHQIFWRIFNNIDAKRDLNIDQLTVCDRIFHVASIDATRKLPEENGGREWPEDIIMSETIVKRVNEKWGQYGFITENH
jgi:4-hydroxy-3-polyprenylbenzoate decarboxylase